MELQETRRHILEILKERGECTVDDIVAALSARLHRQITTVTIRHHLERLRAEDLVQPPQIRRRSTPGRPQYVYALTARALEYFPSNYAGLADNLLEQLKRTLPPNQVNVIMEGMADAMATTARIPNAPMPVRLDYVVQYMTEQGYVASWEKTEDGYILSTSNCPYERIAGSHEEICGFDLRLVSSMLGVVPRMVNRLREGSEACQYHIPHPK